jgi:hypothetical protein
MKNHIDALPHIIWACIMAGAIILIIKHIG